MIAASVLLLLAVIGAVAMLAHHETERDSARRVVARVDAILPQTQCRECGYPGCRPYAEAVVYTGAPIDRCPPGGRAVRRSLAELLGRSSHSLAAEFDEPESDQVVVIDEPTCIGCTKCIQACPVDAILGAAKQMHTVIEELCTGCNLCIEPCPVDCIFVAPAKAENSPWRWPPPSDSRIVTSDGS